MKSMQPFYLLSGFSLITKPGFRSYVVIPLCINIFIFICLFLALQHFYAVFEHWLTSFLPAWLQWLGYIIWVFFFISFFIIFLYSFLTIANIIAAPFNSLLAEKVEYYLTKQKLPAKGLKQNLKDIPRSIWRQVTILGYYLPRVFLLFLLFFIPGIQLIAPILWFVFHAQYMAMTYLDYPTENHNISIANMRTVLKKERIATLQFGASILLVSMIPILNFFVMPAAVAGATVWWLEHNKEKE